MKTLTIDRKKWNRGNGAGSLCTYTGAKCCLGFAANQLCEIPYNDMLGIGTPSELVSEYQEYAKAVKEAGLLKIEDDVIGLNDDDIGEKADRGRDREQKIKKVFGRIGVKVVFKN